MRGSPVFGVARFVLGISCRQSAAIRACVVNPRFVTAAEIGGGGGRPSRVIGHRIFFYEVGTLTNSSNVI